MNKILALKSYVTQDRNGQPIQRGNRVRVVDHGNFTYPNLTLGGEDRDYWSDYHRRAYPIGTEFVVSWVEENGLVWHITDHGSYGLMGQHGKNFEKVLHDGHGGAA